MTVVASDSGLRDEFRRYLREGHFLADSSHLISLTLALYRRLGDGERVARTALTKDLNLSADEVGGQLDELPGSTIEFDEEGAIIAFGGLSLVPANHVFRVEGRELHTWCVFDALFLPELINKSATSVTHCPTTGAQIEVALTTKTIASSRPANPVMSIVAPDRAACRANLRGAFCNHVNFFVDEDAFGDWAADRADVGCVSLEEAHELACQRNLHRYGDRLRMA